MKGMAGVLNEFLHGISQGFADAAFASFKRRRSTVRADINQGFGEEEHKPTSGALAYQKQKDSEDAATAETSAAKPVASPSGSSDKSSGTGGVKGSADVTPKSYEDKLKEMGLKEL